MIINPWNVISVHSHRGWQSSLMGSPPLKSFPRGCSGWRTGVCLCPCWSARWTLSLWSNSPYISAPTHLSWSLHNPWCQKQIHTYTALDSRSITTPPEQQTKGRCLLYGVHWVMSFIIYVMSFSMNNPYQHHFDVKIKSSTGQVSVEQEDLGLILWKRNNSQPIMQDLK